MVFLVIAFIVGGILAVLMFIDGMTAEQLEQERSIQKRIDDEVRKRLEQERNKNS